MPYTVPSSLPTTTVLAGGDRRREDVAAGAHGPLTGQPEWEVAGRVRRRRRPSRPVTRRQHDTGRDRSHEEHPDEEHQEDAAAPCPRRSPGPSARGIGSAGERQSGGVADRTGLPDRDVRRGAPVRTVGGGHRVAERDRERLDRRMPLGGIAPQRPHHDGFDRRRRNVGHPRAQRDRLLVHAVGAQPDPATLSVVGAPARTRARRAPPRARTGPRPDRPAASRRRRSAPPARARCTPACRRTRPRGSGRRPWRAHRRSTRSRSR